MRFILLIVLFFASNHPCRSEITSIYLKNNGIAPADIWINDSYQGYVPGGEIVQADKLGFVTAESNRRLGNGSYTNKVHSHGGWSGYDDVKVTICQSNSKGERYLTSVLLPKEWATTIGSSRYPKVWFGEKSSGAEPEISGEVRTIYKANEPNNCGTGTSNGVASTNALNTTGIWLVDCPNFIQSNGDYFNGPIYLVLQSDGQAILGNKYQGRWQSVAGVISFTVQWKTAIQSLTARGQARLAGGKLEGTLDTERYSRGSSDHDHYTWQASKQQ